IKQFLQSSINVASSDVTVAISITAAPGNDDPSNQVAASQPGDLISLNVSVPFNKVSYVKGKWLNGKNLVGQAMMRHEYPASRSTCRFRCVVPGLFSEW